MQILLPLGSNRNYQTEFGNCSAQVQEVLTNQGLYKYYLLIKDMQGVENSIIEVNFCNILTNQEILKFCQSACQ